MTTSTRVSRIYRERLEALRAAIAALPEGEARAAVECAADNLSFAIGMGFSPVEEVAIEVHSPAELLEQIDGLLDDTEPLTSALRDQRPTEAA